MDKPTPRTIAEHAARAAELLDWAEHVFIEARQFDDDADAGDAEALAVAQRTYVAASAAAAVAQAHYAAAEWKVR